MMSEDIFRVGLLTVSDRAFHKQYEDLGGPAPDPPGKGQRTAAPGSGTAGSARARTRPRDTRKRETEGPIH